MPETPAKPRSRQTRLNVLLAGAGIELPVVLAKASDQELDLALRQLAMRHPNFALRLFASTSRVNDALERFFFDPPVAPAQPRRPRRASPIRTTALAKIAASARP